MLEQISEGVRINEVAEGSLMNSKNEHTELFPHSACSNHTWPLTLTKIGCLVVTYMKSNNTWAFFNGFT